MAETKRLSYTIPIIVFASIALAGIAYLGSYSRFIADDYCSAYYGQKFGLLGSIQYWYDSWSGRYTAFAFDWLIMAHTFGQYGAHFVPPLVIVLWLVAAIGAIYSILKQTAYRSSTLSLALTLGTCFTLTVIVLSPSIPQSYFWLNGLRSYELPLVIASAYVFLFRWMLPRLKSERAVFGVCVLTFFLTFANGGLSETYAVMQVVALAFLTCLHWLSNGRKFDTVFKLLAAATLGALVSLFIIALAPGNTIRKEQLPPRPSWKRIAKISIGAYLSFFQAILVNPQKLSALIGSVLVNIWAGTQYKKAIHFKAWLIPAYIFGGLLLAFICIPPAVYGYAAPPPARTLSIALFGLLACWMSAGFLIGNSRAVSDRSTTHLETGLLISASLAVGVASVLTLSFVNQQKDKYISFAQKWDATDAQILQAKSQGLPSVIITEMGNWAGLDRPNDDPNFWATDCYTRYYGIQVYGPPY